MKNIASSERRVAALEGKRGVANLRLIFPDGSTRGVKVAGQHRLQLLIDSLNRAHAFAPPAPEGEPPVASAPAEPPVTESDNLLKLMESAIRIEGDRLMHTIFGLCQQNRKNQEGTQR